MLQVGKGCNCVLGRQSPAWLPACLTPEETPFLHSQLSSAMPFWTVKSGVSASGRPVCSAWLQRAECLSPASFVCEIITPKLMEGGGNQVMRGQPLWPYHRGSQGRSHPLSSTWAVCNLKEGLTRTHHVGTLTSNVQAPARWEGVLLSQPPCRRHSVTAMPTRPTSWEELAAQF